VKRPKVAPGVYLQAFMIMLSGAIMIKDGMRLLFPEAEPDELPPGQVADLQPVVLVAVPTDDGEPAA
jgi:hypothetical protein